MDISKTILISVIIFAISIVLCSFIISDGLKQLGEKISFGLQSGSNKISSSLYNPTSNNDVMTLEQAAAYLKIEKFELLQIAKGKGLPYVEVGDKYIFSKNAIDRWMGGNTIHIN